MEYTASLNTGNNNREMIEFSPAQTGQFKESTLNIRVSYPNPIFEKQLQGIVAQAETPNRRFFFVETQIFVLDAIAIIEALKNNTGMVQIPGGEDGEDTIEIKKYVNFQGIQTMSFSISHPGIDPNTGQPRTYVAKTWLTPSNIELVAAFLNRWMIAQGEPDQAKQAELILANLNLENKVLQEKCNDLSAKFAKLAAKVKPKTKKAEPVKKVTKPRKHPNYDGAGPAAYA